MKRLEIFSMALATLFMVAGQSMAQDDPKPERDRPERARPEDGRRGGPGGPEGRRRGGPGGPGGGRPVFPMMKALDKDEDGKLSASEIAQSANALLSLDKNGDGELDMEELRPQFGGRGPGGPGGANGAPGPGGRPGPGRPGGGNMDPSEFLNRILQADKNGDGVLSKDEVPERMAQNFERLDTNSDGVIDKAELKQMMERFRQGGNRPGQGKDGGRGGDNNVRPERPQRPDAE